MLKGLIQSRNTKEETDTQNQTPNNQENGNRNKYINNQFNVNGLNAPTKRHRLAEWIQKQDPYICCLQETHFRPKDTYKLKVREQKNKFHANGKQKKAGVAILISDKIDLKLKNVIRDKGSIHEEDMTIINIYAPNISIHKTNTNRHKRRN